MICYYHLLINLTKCISFLTLKKEINILWNYKDVNKNVHIIETSNINSDDLKRCVKIHSSFNLNIKTF